MRDAVDLHERMIGDVRDRDGGSHRRIGAEAPLVSGVHALEVLHVGEVDVHLQHLVHRRTRDLERFLDLIEDVFRLFGDVPFRVHARALARQEDEVAERDLGTVKRLPLKRLRPSRSVLQYAHGDGQTHTPSAADDVGSDDRVADAASHPFYRRLNQLLREHGFDDFVEGQCASFYAETMGRPGVPPGIYFRLLLIGHFEGIGSEQGIAWRAADSLALRDFLSVGLGDDPPDHSTISRTRRLIALETHRAVSTWVLQCLGAAGLVKGKTIGIDATTLEANAALRSIVRRDTGEDYEEFLAKLAKASGVGTRRSRK